MPRRYRLSLPLWCLQGGLNPSGTGYPCHCGAWRAVCPLRHLLDLPRGRGPSQTPKFLSPGPPSPWLPALLAGNRFLSVLRQTGDAEGTPPAGRVVRPHFPAPRGFRRGDARGAAPCIKITLVSPFPPGRGSGGWGRKRKLKAGQAGDQNRRAPYKATRRQGNQATKKASPPPGAANARRAGNAGGTPPAGGKPPFGTATPPPPIKNSRKVLGGSGDSFKSPPKRLLSPPQQQLSLNCARMP